MKNEIKETKDFLSFTRKFNKLSSNFLRYFITHFYY